MAKQRWEEVESNRQLTDRVAGLVGHGMTYRKARARVLRDWQRTNPGEPPPHANTLKRAEEQARNERAAAGRTRRAETRARNAATARNIAAARAEHELPLEQREVIQYERRGDRNAAVGDRRYDLRYTDPRTGLDRAVTVYVPSVGTESREQMLAMLAAAIAQHDSTTESEQQAAIRGAIRGADDFFRVF